jgi:hypothetical protein
LHDNWGYSRRFSCFIQHFFNISAASGAKQEKGVVVMCFSTKIRSWEEEEGRTGQK